jgi:hypothetical protein
MSDRFWVVRPSHRSRLTLHVCARESAGRRDAVELKALDTDGCVVGFHGLLLEIGQPVALCFASGGILNGFVREAAERDARIRFDHSLSPLVVRAISQQHASFLRDLSAPDPTVRSSAA